MTADTITTQQWADDLGAAMGYQTDLLHTGGGCMVVGVDLTQDGRWLGPQIWLTDDWDSEGTILAGFYDFHTDPEDEGVCVALMVRGTTPSPAQVAEQLLGILKRLGVRYIG